MSEHKSLSPCSFCGEKLFLDIDESGGVGILHSLKEKDCFFPSILEIEMPVGTTLEQMIEKINRRPIQESFEHAIVGASLVSLARIQDKDFEIQALKAELAELRERTRWIPCKEKMPEIGKRVLSLGGDGITDDETMKSVFSDAVIFIDNINVTHWMPLPTPPEDE